MPYINASRPLLGSRQIHGVLQRSTKCCYAVNHYEVKVRHELMVYRQMTAVRLFDLAFWVRFAEVWSLFQIVPLKIYLALNPHCRRKYVEVRPGIHIPGNKEKHRNLILSQPNQFMNRYKQGVSLLFISYLKKYLLYCIVKCNRTRHWSDMWLFGTHHFKTTWYSSRTFQKILQISALECNCKIQPLTFRFHKTLGGIQWTLAMHLNFNRTNTYSTCIWRRRFESRHLSGIRPHCRHEQPSVRKYGKQLTYVNLPFFRARLRTQF